MKRLARFLKAVLVLSTLGVAGSLVAPMWMSQQAELIQRVAPYDADMAQLTGEVGELVGRPQLMIIGDSNAFLPGETSDGVKMVSDPYLKQHDIYPLQLKTVRFVSTIASMVSFAGVGMSIAGLFFMRKRCAV